VHLLIKADIYDNYISLTPVFCVEKIYLVIAGAGILN
jgi:hypothetical protein